MSPFELTLQLMNIPSVTGTEGKVGQALSAQLSSLGYRVENQPVSVGRFNVLAYAGGEPKVVLCTHIDTVPPVIPIREDGDCLYGRGSCDAKGIIAAMIEAGERLRRSGVENFAFLFVVGEETGGDGARAANALKWNSKYVIVGEPTRNLMATAQKGTLRAELTAIGRAAHSGYPEEGISAIEALWGVLDQCRNADWGADRVLGRGSFNIGVFQGGEAANIVPARATASIMIRVVEPAAQVEKRLRAIAGDKVSIEIMSCNDPYRMHTVDGFPSTVVSFGSDVPYLTNLGKPLLVGPGSILDAHTANEKIVKRELLDGVDLYERLVRRLLE